MLCCVVRIVCLSVVFCFVLPFCGRVKTQRDKRENWLSMVVCVTEVDFVGNLRFMLPCVLVLGHGLLSCICDTTTGTANAKPRTHQKRTEGLSDLHFSVLQVCLAFDPLSSVLCSHYVESCIFISPHFTASIQYHSTLTSTTSPPQS
jgi:hypothetical protein